MKTNDKMLEKEVRKSEDPRTLLWGIVLYSFTGPSPGTSSKRETERGGHGRGHYGVNYVHVGLARSPVLIPLSFPTSIICTMI